jgi:aminoglycoside phosphotransferase (APT) family kinase protein
MFTQPYGWFKVVNVVMLEESLGPAVAEWLSHMIPDAQPPWSCERITGGYSMFTYRLNDSAGQAWVLRHPPAGNRSGGAHSTDREARVMSALAGSAVPVPTVRAIGTDADPLGLPCHVTDFVAGYVLSDFDAAVSNLAPAAIRTASIEIVRALADLHSVDPDEVGLGDFAPRDDYVGRQLHRWTTMVLGSDQRGMAALAEGLMEMADVLTANVPANPASSIVHGDYRLGNAIVDETGGVRAILDWELATLGDPLADLGLLAAFWNPPARAMLGVRMPTAAPNAISLEEVLDRYVAATGADLSMFWFYEAFSAWRLACTAFRARMRYASGAMNDNAGASRFEVTCAAWTDIAGQALAAR